MVEGVCFRQVLHTGGKVMKSIIDDITEHSGYTVDILSVVLSGFILLLEYTAAFSQRHVGVHLVAFATVRNMS